MSGVDRLVLIALQGLVVLLPLFLGGRETTAVAVANAVVIGLLLLTIRERRRRDESPEVPGLLALAAFLGLALFSTLPLPPGLLEWLSPAAADLYARALPEWPTGGGWSSWRPLALSAYDVVAALSRIAIGLGAFVVIIAFPWRTDPWREEEPRGYVIAHLTVAVLAGGVLVAALGLLERAAGNGFVLWVSEELATEGRASGPFVNPNHYAAWLEMVIPVAGAAGLALFGRLAQKIAARAESGRGMGVRARRAWVAALVAHQQRLWPSLVAAVALILLFAAHAASGSRGGRAALLAGLGVAGAGLALRAGADATRTRLWRGLALATAASLVLAALASLVLWAGLQTEVATSGMAAAGDMSLGARLAAASLGSGIVRDFPFFGTGLGSWLHAFRPYQAPPLETGILDHAHNDYLELAAESGLAGVVVVLVFTGAVLLAVGRRRRAEVAAQGARREGSGDRPPGFELPEWRLALRQHHLLRWGLAGGIAAVLVHSLVDFGLRLPANLLLLMVLVALLLLAAGPARPGRAPALAAVLAVVVLAALPQVANRVLVAWDATPLSPEQSVERAELVLAEEGEEGLPRARRLVHGALDRAPAYREAHELLALIHGPGTEGDAALRRALALHPWSVELRDDLGLRLWENGNRTAGAAELEESMRRYPWFRSHTYLTYGDGTDEGAPTAAEAIRTLTEPDSLNARLASLDPQMAGALERGLRRALAESLGGPDRARIVDQIATLLELRERWADAGELLRTEAQRSGDATELLARAARDFLRAEDDRAAEQVLLAALLRGPEQGTLYRKLAVDVYAPRGEFDMAAAVLEAAQRNAIDLMPVYLGVTEVLARRKAAERSGLHAAGDAASVSVVEPLAATEVGR